MTKKKKVVKKKSVQKTVRKPATNPTQVASRGSRHDGLRKCIALAELFRTSRGRAYNIRDLKKAAHQKYPTIFDHEPSADTISRFVEVLISVGVPLTKTTAAAESLPGARNQLVWKYTPADPLLQGLDGLSDMQEQLDVLVELAVAAEALAPLQGFKLHDNLIDLRDRLAASLDAGVKTGAHQASKRVRVSGKKKKTAFPKVEEERRARLRVIDECVREGRRLKLTHKQRADQPRPKEYLVEPRALNQRNGSLYLFAHCVATSSSHSSPSLRQFKVDRISRVEKLPQNNSLAYDPTTGELTGCLATGSQPPLDLDHILGRTIHDFLPPPSERPLQDIVIHVRPELANWVNEELLNPQQKTTFTKLEDGVRGLEVRIANAYLNDITPRLQGLGASVKVLAPPALVDHLRGKLLAAAAQYGPVDKHWTTEGGKPPRP